MENCEMDRFRCGDYSSLQSDVKMTRSRPDTRLSELEEQLEVAETRCGSLKSQLDYMKMLYQGVQSYPTDSTETGEELPQTEPQNTAQPSPRDTVKETTIAEDVENFEENRIDSAEDIKYYEFLKEIHKMKEITRELEHADLRGASPRKSTKSPTITPRIVEEQESISADCRRTKQVRKTYTLLESADEEGAPMLMPVTAAVTSLQIPEVGNEHDADDATTSHHPYQHSLNYSARVQADLATARILTSRFMSDNNREYEGYELDDDKKELRKQELVLKLSESVASTRVTVKRKRITKVDKKQKTGTSARPVSKKTLNSKLEDTLSVTSNNKSKKKKGKLRTATSRNTVTTKETNLTDRRDSKKRKQKGFSSATHMPHRFQVPIQRTPVTKAEVVEIYHNNAVEGGSGSISISSSKHSKDTAQPKNNNPVVKKTHPAQTSSAVSYQHQLSRNCDERKDSQEDESCEARVAFGQKNNEEFQNYSSRSQKSQNHATKDADAEAAQCNSTPHPSQYYDPTITRNYELPTVASELKKVSRSYYNRFNFRNIPFVVSTSVTPSHNLGLNIQQVLSIMKTRQPMGTGMTPLLIRKMSKGMRPVGALMDCINESSLSPKSPKSTILGRPSDYIPSARPQTTADCTSTLINETVKPSKYTGSSTTQNSRFNRSSSDEMKQRDSLFEEDVKDLPSDMKWAEQQESSCICCPKKSQSYDRTLKQYTSRKSITGNPTLTSSALLRERQEEINIGDNQYNKFDNASGNGKGIREVLINLHDQFEELNTAYEKLQEQAAKSNDKSIKKQIAALEQELNAKEEEINAVVGLYKEVLQLKHQMNSTHGNNSFVCITTGNNPSSPGMVRRSGHMRPQLVTNPMQMYSVRDKGLSSNTREPATATRLTGLLREIQSFQKQLLAL